MALYHRDDERKRLPLDFRRKEEEVVDSLCRLGNRPASPRSLLEQEKRIRREIANSNERRRMQSINAGFQSLRTLLPRREGENLSKAAILQNTADYIFTLEQENARLLEQNSQLKRRALNTNSSLDSDGSCSDSPIPKRKKHQNDSADEGISIPSPRSDNGMEDVKRKIIDLKFALDREKSLRLNLEDQIRNLKSQLCTSDSSHTRNESIHHQNESENVTSATDVDYERSSKSPLTYCSSSEAESFYELEDSSANILKVPLNLVKNAVILPCVTEMPLTVTSNQLISAAPISVVPPSTESDSSYSTLYQPNACRQSLETIVEAIRHVEGDHVFRDDPSPFTIQCKEETNSNLIDEEQSTKQSHDTVHVLKSGEVVFRHQVIRSASTPQSRPGVIVANHT